MTSNPKEPKAPAAKGGRPRRGGFSSESARVAGRSGGAMVSRDVAHMSEIGRRGAEASQARARTNERARGDADVERAGDEDTAPGDETTRDDGRAKRRE